MLLSVFGVMRVSLANTEIEACSQQLEGENCSFSISGSFVRHGICQKIGPQNHSMLACLRLANVSDPACRRGLLHTASRACCASHCSSCHVLPELSMDPACSVEHILRLSPSCSQSGPPCVLVRYSVGQILAAKNASNELLEPAGKANSKTVSASQEASLVSDLILPLIGGFAVSGCALTLFCSMLYCLAIQRASQPSPSSPAPTSPTTKSFIGRRPEPKRKAKAAKAAKAKPKKGKVHELKDRCLTNDLPDTWNILELF